MFPAPVRRNSPLRPRSENEQHKSSRGGRPRLFFQTKTILFLKKIFPTPVFLALGSFFVYDYFSDSSIMTSINLRIRRCSSTGRRRSFCDTSPLSCPVVTSRTSDRSRLASHCNAFAIATKVFSFGILKPHSILLIYFVDRSTNCKMYFYLLYSLLNSQ